MNYRWHSFLILFLGFHSVQADTLSAEAAVQLALQNNFNIKLADISGEMLAVENSYGAAGFWPSVTADAQYSKSINDVKQQFYDGASRETNNAVSGSTTAGIFANWTIFDGLAMFALKKRLDEMEAAGEFALRAATELTITDVLVNYYRIAAEVSLAEVLDQNLVLSRQRRTIAYERFRLGAGSELLYLQGTADFVSDSMLVIQKNAEIKRLKGELNLLMARSPDTPFEVSRQIPLMEQMQYQTLLESMVSKNPLLLQARAEAQAAAQLVNEARGARFPRISVFGGYNYAKSVSEAGLLQSNRSLGPQYGIGATYDIFAGGLVNRRSKIAGLQAQSSRLELDRQILESSNSLFASYTSYQLAHEQLMVEEQNVSVVRRSASIALEAYKLGSISDLQLREIQMQLLDAESRLYAARFDVKSNELLLKQLAGIIQ